ncbi:MAG: PLP-dependent transferase [Sphingobium sp.]
MTERDRPLPDVETIAAAYGVAADPAFGAVAPPLYLSSTYEFAGYEQPRIYDYGRAGNPTRDMLAGGLRAGDLVLAPHDCYGGTMRLLKARAERGQIGLRLVDQGSAAAFDAALEASPALVLIETPSNPLMRVIDIAALAGRAKAAGAEVAVDNTFLSPAIQRPILLGADYVIHSTTKYLNGHSDVIGGAVVAADKGKAEQLRQWANVVGSAGGPFDAWLTLQGLRTLFARLVERQQANAMAVAHHLENHRAVAKVHYPGLRSHPGHGVASRQQRGFGAMLSFELAGGVEAVRRFLPAVRFFTLAESLGGVESLVAHPATMTHADMGEEARAVAGISDGLLRFSIGLEAEKDLIAGLEEGLAACA